MREGGRGGREGMREEGGREEGGREGKRKGGSEEGEVHTGGYACGMRIVLDVE